MRLDPRKTLKHKARSSGPRGGVWGLGIVPGPPCAVLNPRGQGMGYRMTNPERNSTGCGQVMKRPLSSTPSSLLSHSRSCIDHGHPTFSILGLSPPPPPPPGCVGSSPGDRILNAVGRGEGRGDPPNYTFFDRGTPLHQGDLEKQTVSVTSPKASCGNQTPPQNLNHDIFPLTDLSLLIC